MDQDPGGGLPPGGTPPTGGGVPPIGGTPPAGGTPPGGGGMPPAPPLLPKPVGDILTAAFQLYKDNWMQFFKIVAVLAIPLIILIRAIIALAFSSNSGAAIAFGVLLSALAYFVVSYTLTGAITRAAASSVVGLPVDVEATFAYALKRLGSVILVALLAALAILVPIIAVTIILGLAKLWLLVVLADIVLGVFLGIKLAVALPSLIVEDRRGTDTLTRSWDLTTGHFWHVLGAVVVAGLIASIVGSLVGALFGFGGWFVRAIGEAVAQIVTAPFTALVTILVYLDLRARKENLSSDGLRAELARSS